MNVEPNSFSAFLRGGKISRSPSEFSEPVNPQPKEEQPRKINSTVGNDLQGDTWEPDTKAQVELADNFDIMEAAENIAERRKAGRMKYIGLMQQGKEKNLIRDNQVVHLAQVREQEMAKEMANQISEIIEEQLRGFRNPDQLTEPLRDTIHLQQYRLDADDEHQNVPVHQMNDSSSDSGGSLKSETHPEICWEAHGWIK